jgi:hypothetical protein
LILAGSFHVVRSRRVEDDGIQVDAVLLGFQELADLGIGVLSKEL